MKKIIVFVALFIVVPVSMFAQNEDRLRVAIQIQGFQDGHQALQMIVGHAANASAGAWEIVSNSAKPDYVLEVRANTNMMKSWSQVNRASQTRNSVLRAGSQIANDLIYSIPGNSRVAWTLKNAGQNAARGQFQARERQEWEYYQKWRATVEIRMIETKTRQVLSYGIGQRTVTVRTFQAYDSEPMVILTEGDLSNVGIGQGVNLDGNFRQLIALSAFLESDLPQNTIVRQ